MERMCELKLMEDYLPRWKALNDQVIENIHRTYIDELSIYGLFLYCEGCEREMYWPVLYVHNQDKHTKLELTESKLEFGKGGIDAFYFDKYPYLNQLEEACSKVSKNCYDLLNNQSDMDKCPFCGEKVIYDNGHFLRRSRSGIHGLEVLKIYSNTAWSKEYIEFSEDKLEACVRSKFEMLRNNRINAIKNKETRKARKYSDHNIKKFLSNNENSRGTAILSPINCEIIKNSTDNLKQFVFDVLKMETCIRGLQQRLKNLYYKKELSELQYKRELQTDEKRKAILNKQVEEEENKLLNYAPTKESLGIRLPNEPKKVHAPELSKPGLFNKKKVEAENKRLQEEYQKQLNDYNTKYQEYQMELSQAEILFEEKAKAGRRELEETIETIKQEIVCLSQGAQSKSQVETVVDKEITMAETALHDAFAARNDFYNTNIIYMKYRNPVALSSFYEYLISGRCTELEGVNGAYNLYENELRLNLIIDQLDQVIDSLEQIKQNQFTIYNELKEMNSTLHSLETSMDKAIDSIHKIERHSRDANKLLSDISNNTAVAAYYSKVNAYYAEKTAQLTNAIGWLVAFK